MMERSIAVTRPNRSAASRKLVGEIRAPSSSRIRASVSTATTFPVRVSAIGW